MMSPRTSMTHEKLLRFVFRIAAVYNFVWGAVVIAFPNLVFELFQMPLINYPFLMRGIGMFVGLYGYAYWVVASDLARYPQLVVIGLLGKTLGPVGWFYAVASGEVPSGTLWLIVFNDFVWLPFFVAYFVWRGNDQGAPRDRRTLYQRVLGEDFAALPAVLRRFHSCQCGASGAGVFVVTRGHGALRSLVGRLLGLPPCGQGVSVELQVIAREGREIWIRRFGGHTVSTVQSEKDGYLHEARGAFELAFHLVRTENGLRYQQEGCRFLGLSLPRRLWLLAEAQVEGCDSHWNVDAGIDFATLGMIARYHGTITPSL